MNFSFSLFWCTPSQKMKGSQASCCAQALGTLVSSNNTLTTVWVMSLISMPHNTNKHLLRYNQYCIWEPGQHSLHSNCLQVGGPRGRGRTLSPGRAKNFLFSMSSRQALGPGYWGLFPQRLSGRSVKLMTHLKPVPRSRKCGPIHPFPHAPSWPSA
jgi:hypothetical protein